MNVMIYSILVFIKVKGCVVSRCTEERYDNFIGWKSSDGLLEVIGVHSESKNGKPKMYKVTCTECSKDSELFPEGYFVSTKGNLERNKKPCGCSKLRREPYQYLIMANRIGEGRFIVNGFSEDFKNQSTRLKLECLKDGHNWLATIKDVLYHKTGCTKCAEKLNGEKLKIPPNIALQKCTEICKEVDYEPIGFPDNYKNNTSYFEYICKIHGKQSTSYSNFTRRGSRCPSCASYGYNPSKYGSFYVVRWQHKDKKFIKFGITNREVLTRIEEQSDETMFEYELIFSASFTDGNIPLMLEKAIKACPEIIKTCISKEEFPDGFTETTTEYCLELLEDVVINTLTTI